LKTNGSAYVAVVVAALAGYFSYQWWFNPHRVIMRELGELAAALSVPANESDVNRLARLATVRRLLSPSARIRAGDVELASRDAAMAALAAWTPPPSGVNVDFVDVQVNVDAADTARAYATVEVTRRDGDGKEPSVDSREVEMTLALDDGVWVITRAAPNDLRRQP
jgi:hypothetical protein